jgi:hypothetical protein
MTILSGISPSPVPAPIHPVPPSAGGAPGGVPSFGPPNPPTTPPGGMAGVAANFVVDLTESSRLVARAVELLDTVPRSDTGAESTKDLRIRIFKTNLAAQARLERQLAAGNPQSVVSELRRADAHLEDANWQLAKKPSPDGRFTGVDIPGAIRDTAEGARIIDELLRAAGGTPSTPATPPPVGPPVDPPAGPPPGPPTGPSFPPPGEPEPPTTPNVPPPGPGEPQPPTPGGGSPDPDYPGEDEFPTDDEIRGDT